MKTLEFSSALSLLNTVIAALQQKKIAQAMADAGAGLGEVHAALMKQISTFLGNALAFPEVMAKVREWITAECGRTTFSQ